MKRKEYLVKELEGLLKQEGVFSRQVILFILNTKALITSFQQVTLLCQIKRSNMRMRKLVLRQI